MQNTVACAKTCVLNAQQRQKHYYDKWHVLSDSVFDIGAEVLLAITNLHLRTTGTHKLILKWVRPCKDLARMGGYYGNEHNTEGTTANVANSLDCVRDYWLTLPPDQRLAAAAVLLPIPQQAGSAIQQPHSCVT